jgi:hypothetical protein
VLFSQKPVADFINQSFEPVWESVRPVPIVRIDFGDGKVLTRTLHGNILTSICTSEGLVVDALPGIYQESEYRKQISWLCAVAKNAQAAPAARRDLLVRAYHRGQVEGLKKGLTPQQFAALKQIVSITKARIETPVELALLPVPLAPVPAQRSKPQEKPAATATEDVAGWKELEEDTRLNERTRRLQIHELLARSGLVRPEKVTRPIYKDVLHADLDDPYLGLGKVLFARYPFAKEDAGLK